MAPLLRGGGSGCGAAAPRRSRRVPHFVRARSNFLFALWAALLLAALPGTAGCGNGSDAAAGPGEPLAYLKSTGDRGSLMLTSTAGGEGDALLEWRGSAERFFFSNDGRYLTMNVGNQPPGTPPRHRYFVAAADGSRALHLAGLIDLPSFSPDSTRIAYVTLNDAGPNDVAVMDLASGQARTVATGNGLINPVWTDDRTLAYTEVGGTTTVSRAAGGVIHRIDLATGQDAALTPPGRQFSAYSAPVTWPRPKLALIERSSQNHIWSLDVAAGRLEQVTNNIQDHYRATYLADGRHILFQQQKSRADTMSSELCVLADDGSDFRMLTSNFFFDGLQSFSPVSGRIAWQQAKDTGETSVWVMDGDGTGASKLVETPGNPWVGDPNFVPASGWEGRNPLTMNVFGGNGQPLKVIVANTSDGPVEAVLRAFPGNNLTLAPAGRHERDARRQPPPEPGDVRGLDAADPELLWNLKLGPRETTEVVLNASIRTFGDQAGETALLLTLAVPGAMPRMFWDLQGLMQRP